MDYYIGRSFRIVAGVGPDVMNVYKIIVIIKIGQSWSTVEKI
jgi:hypothetical protein